MDSIYVWSNMTVEQSFTPGIAQCTVEVQGEKKIHWVTFANKQGIILAMKKLIANSQSWVGGLYRGLPIDCNWDIFEPAGISNFLNCFFERDASKIAAKNKRTSLLPNTIKLTDTSVLRCK